MEKNTRKSKKSLNKISIVIFLILLFLLLFTLKEEVVIASTRPLVRNFEKQMISLQTKNYTTVETENFIIKYNQIEAETLALIIKTAEDKYQIVREAFQYQPQGKVPLIIYDDPNFMMKVTYLDKGTPPMGVYFGNSLHILDPSHWIKEKEDLEDIFYYEGPVLHELVHLFTDHLAGGNFPMWFTEGVSLYFEYVVDNYEWGREAEFIEGEYTLEELYHSFYELDPYLAYTKSFRIVKAYVDESGEDSLFQLIRALGRGEKLETYFPIIE